MAVGAVAAGKALYDVGAEFDDAFDTIRTSTGKTGKALESLEGSFKKVVQEVPADFEEVSTAISDVEKRLGLMGKPLEARSKQFIELSRITDTDLAGNIESVARAFEDAAVPTGKQGEKLDELYRASQLSGASVAELADNMAKFGSPLRQLGIGFDQSLAMFAEFQKTGVNISTMVPGLKQALKTFLEEGKNPAQALRETFKGLEDGTVKTSEALKTFGARAGADMIEAVDQGRFHLEAFQKKIVDGKDTINKAGESTKDASERFQELGNKLKVLVAPAAQFVFEKVGQLADYLAHFNIRKFARDLGLSKEDIKTVGQALHNVGEVLSKYFGPIVKTVVAGVKKYLEGFAEVVRGIVRTISAILTGQWGKAWDGVKEIFRGGIKTALGFVTAATANARRGAEVTGGAVLKGFEWAWDKIKGVFEDGRDIVVGFVQDILDVINVLPGVDIHIDASGPETTSRKDAKKAFKKEHRYTGGPITRPMAIVGEEAPQHHEWVIATNPKYRSSNIGYWMQAGRDLGIPGFFSGGDILDTAGSIGKGIVENSPPGLAYRAGKAVFNTAKDAIGALPTPDLPDWMGNLGGWVIDKVGDWITSGFDSGKLKTQVSSGGGGPVPAGFKDLVAHWQPNHPMWDVWQVGKLLQSMGYEVAENPHFGGVNPVHTGTSYHYRGRAIDVNADNMAGGEKANLDRLYSQLVTIPHTELLWQVEDHFDHLHYAYRKGGLRGGPAGHQSASPRHRAMHDYHRFYTWAKRHGYKGMGIGPFGALLNNYAGNQGLPANQFYKLHGSVHASEPWFGKWNAGKAFKKGGRFDASSIKHSGVLTPFEWAIAMLLAGFPAKLGVIAAGLGTIKSESSFNASSQVPGNEHEGGWALSDAFGPTSMKLNPILSSKAAFKEWKSSGGFWQAWGQWEAEQSGLAGGGAGTYGPEYMATAEEAIKKFLGGGGKAGARGGGRGTGEKKFKAGHTSKGGGTYGSPAYAPSHYGPTKYGPSPVKLPGLGKGHIPKVLQGIGMAPIEAIFKEAPSGLSDEAKFELSERALEVAELSERNVFDDRAVYKYQLGLAKRRKQAIQKQLKKVNAELKKPQTQKRQNQLKTRRKSLEEELRSQNQRVSAARQGVRGESSEGYEGEEGEAPETEGERKQREAIEANTRALEEEAVREEERKVAEEERKRAEEERKQIEEEHTASIKDLEKEMKLNREIAESIQGTAAAAAMKSLADLLSGYLGPKTLLQTALPGRGSVGTF